MDRDSERDLQGELEKALGVKLPPLGSHEFHLALLKLSQVKPEALAVFAQVFGGSVPKAPPKPEGEAFLPPQGQLPISSPGAAGEGQGVPNPGGLGSPPLPPEGEEPEKVREGKREEKKGAPPLKGSGKGAVEKRLRSKQRASDFLNRLFKYLEPHWRVPVPHPRKVLMALLLVGSPLAIYWVFQEPINNLLRAEPPSGGLEAPLPPPPPPQGEQTSPPPATPPTEAQGEGNGGGQNTPPPSPNREATAPEGGGPNAPAPNPQSPSPSPQDQGQVPPPPLPVYGEELPPPPSQGGQGGSPSIPSVPVTVGRPSTQPGAPLVAGAGTGKEGGATSVGVLSKRAEEARILRGGSPAQGNPTPGEGGQGSGPGSSPTGFGPILVRKTPGEERMGALKETFKVQSSAVRKDGERPAEGPSPSNENPSSPSAPPSAALPSAPSTPSPSSPSSPTSSLPLPANLRDLVGGASVLQGTGGTSAPQASLSLPGASPAPSGGSQGQLQGAPQPSSGQTLPFKYGQTLRGELLTGIVFAEGGSSESPILIRVQEGGQEYIFFGVASLNPRTNRVTARFDRIYKDGVAYVISGYMVDSRGTIGIYARVSEEAPNAAVNLVRGAFGGLKQYVDYYTKATQTTIIPGTGVVTSSAPPPLGLTVLSSALGQLAAPPDQVSIVRIWSVDAKTPVGVIVAPPQ